MPRFWMTASVHCIRAWWVSSGGLGLKRWYIYRREVRSQKQTLQFAGRSRVSRRYPSPLQKHNDLITLEWSVPHWSKQVWEGESNGPSGLPGSHGAERGKSYFYYLILEEFQGWFYFNSSVILSRGLNLSAALVVFSQMVATIFAWYYSSVNLLCSLRRILHVLFPAFKTKATVPHKAWHCCNHTPTTTTQNHVEKGA